MALVKLSFVFVFGSQRASGFRSPPSAKPWRAAWSSRKKLPLSPTTSRTWKATGEALDLWCAEEATRKETVEDAIASNKDVAVATAVLQAPYQKAASATASVQLSKADPRRASGH